MTLRWVPGYRPLDDPDAENYILAVQAADEAASPGIGELEDEVKAAIHAFIKGCKADGIWPAIKASCILAGARTLEGALVPLVGTAPTNFNFVSGDYNRKTGLAGDGSSKYLNSNRAGNADPQDNFHICVHATSVHSGVSSAGAYAGNGGTGTGATNLFRGISLVLVAHAGRCRTSAQSGSLGSDSPPPGLFGVSRSASGSYVLRTELTNFTVSTASQSPATGNYLVFAREDGSGSPQFHANARLAFYSIGEALDLEKLDNRVTALINQFGAVIP